MGETTQKQSTVDWNKVISDLIMRHEQAILSKATEKLTSTGRKMLVDSGRAFTDYLKRALEKYSKVKTLLYRNDPRYLYEFYEFNDVEKLNHEKISCDHIKTLLDCSQYSIILGDGGSGKSMLMRHFFINAVQESESIPVFVELRYIDADISLFDYIYKNISQLGFRQDSETFRYALERGKFIIILDGYDEVNLQARDTFFRRLEQFCDNYYKNSVIVSTRKNENFISWQRFTVYNIRPLNKTHALSMIEKLDYDPDIKTKFYQQLCDGLFASHTSFASNPLLLCIMLLTFDQYANIPEKLHIFYSYAFDTLYSMHDATKGGYKREMRCALSCDIFRMIFANFSFRTYIEGKYQFSKEEILKLLEQSGDKVKNFEKEAYFDDLLVAVCLICEEGLEYRYTHRSFQEYFAAVYLSTFDDARQKIACRAVLKACSGNISADKVFEMLHDMGEDRFEKNYIIPVLREIEATCPSLSDPVQRYFYGIIDCCRIFGSVKSLLEDSTSYDLAFPMSQEEGDGIGILAVKCKNREHGNFVFSLNRYFKFEPRTGRQRLNIKYWEITYTANEIWNEPRLQDYFVRYLQLGHNIKFASTLLHSLEEKQKQEDKNLQEILNSLL